ncbi:MAG: hypothetical protein CMJ38_07935 [Phycisphaerae bacterium]|nr:hypothetical protein [Phycisphaerae bacterium]
MNMKRIATSVLTLSLIGFITVESYGQDKQSPSGLSGTKAPTSVGGPKPSIGKAPSAQPAQDVDANQVIVASPTSLDLGEISTSEKATGIVTLTNTSDAPVKILQSKASCGCTTSDFKPNSIIQPGESLDVEVEMAGKGRARTISKTVTFNIEGYPSLRVPVKVKTIAYVTIDRDPVTIGDSQTTKLTLTSIDGQPFKVTNMVPAASTGLSEEAAPEQTIEIDWDEWWNNVMSTKMTIRLDHPLCKEITTNVRLNPEQRARLNDLIRERRASGDLITKDPSKPLTGDQLARHIKAGQGEKVLKYIEEGKGKYNAVDKGGVSLLSVAAEEGDADTIIGLLDMGEDVERVDRVNRTPLMYAARSKNNEAIQVLLDAGADIQSRDTLGNAPISWASGFGNADGVALLIENGADVNVRDAVLGYTPLLWASGFGDANSIPILLKEGADVSVRDNAEGRTPLMHAVRTGTLAGVEQLLGADASLTAIDNGGQTAVMIAAGSNNVTLAKVKLLVESGADVTAKDKAGLNALDHAKSRTDAQGELIVKYLESL